MRIEDAITPEQFADALAVRFEVFVNEQGFAAEGERDELDSDPRTLHVVAYDDAGAPVATGRLLAPHTDAAHHTLSPTNPHIGRVAVRASATGTGAGAAIMRHLEAAALARHGAHGHVRVELSAQDQAIPFYERLGYTIQGDGYLDEHSPHHDAFKDLP